MEKLFINSIKAWIKILDLREVLCITIVKKNILLMEVFDIIYAIFVILK